MTNVTNLVNVQIENNKQYGLVVSSRVVAQQLGKEHKNVVAQVEKLLVGSKLSPLIVPSQYVDKCGRNKKEYLLTKDGFTLYMFNIQGYNDFKLAYINRFNEMEKALQAKEVASYQIADPIERAQKWIEEEKARQKLLTENTEMKPKAEYFDDLVDRNLLTSFRETAKELGVKEKPFIQWLLANRYVYRDQSGKLLPYACAKTAELFEVKECTSKHNAWAGTQTLITPKGREIFRLLYRE